MAEAVSVPPPDLARLRELAEQTQPRMNEMTHLEIGGPWITVDFLCAAAHPATILWLLVGGCGFHETRDWSREVVR